MYTTFEAWCNRLITRFGGLFESPGNWLSITRPSNFAASLFFFQAEDGIRDGRVTGVRRVLFRSWPRANNANDTAITCSQSSEVIKPSDTTSVVVSGLSCWPGRTSLVVGVMIGNGNR